MSDRNNLWSVVHADKANGLEAPLVANKVKVVGRMYGVDQMRQLPNKCNPDQICTKEDNAHYVFGRYTSLSNLYPCKFSLAGTQYNCMEQFIQQHKVEKLVSNGIVQKVTNFEKPELQQRLEDLCQEHCPVRSPRRAEILPALLPKFRQNPEL
jgi:hypothetical protein